MFVEAHAIQKATTEVQAKVQQQEAAEREILVNEKMKKVEEEKHQQTSAMREIPVKKEEKVEEKEEEKKEEKKEEEKEEKKGGNEETADEWSVSEVAQWIEKTFSDALLSEAFRKNNVGGKDLFALTARDFVEKLGVRDMITRYEQMRGKKERDICLWMIFPVSFFCFVF